MSKARLGKKLGPLSEEHKKKIADALRGKKIPQHVIDAMQKGRRNTTMSAEGRAKIAEANRKRVWSAESRARVSEVSKKQNPSAELRERRGESIKAAWDKKRSERFLAIGRRMEEQKRWGSFLPHLLT